MGGHRPRKSKIMFSVPCGCGGATATCATVIDNSSVKVATGACSPPSTLSWTPCWPQAWADQNPPIPRQNCPICPPRPPSGQLPTLFYTFVWNIEGCSSLLYSATEILKEKARGLFSGFTVSLLFALGSFFSFYLHFTGSVYASLMLAISAERSS